MDSTSFLTKKYADIVKEMINKKKEIETDKFIKYFEPIHENMTEEEICEKAEELRDDITKLNERHAKNKKILNRLW